MKTRNSYSILRVGLVLLLASSCDISGLMSALEKSFLDRPENETSCGCSAT